MFQGKKEASFALKLKFVCYSWESPTDKDVCFRPKLGTLGDGEPDFCHKGTERN